MLHVATSQRFQAIVQDCKCHTLSLLDGQAVTLSRWLRRAWPRQGKAGQGRAGQAHLTTPTAARHAAMTGRSLWSRCHLPSLRRSPRRSPAPHHLAQPRIPSPGGHGGRRSPAHSRQLPACVTLRRAVGHTQPQHARLLSHLCAHGPDCQAPQCSSAQLLVQPSAGDGFAIKLHQMRRAVNH
jgi:hypothetical protein